MSYASASRLNCSIAPEAMKSPLSLAPPSRTSQAVRSLPGYAKQQAALKPSERELSPARSESCRGARMDVSRSEWVMEHAGLASTAGQSALIMQPGLAKAANVVCNPAIPMTDDSAAAIAGHTQQAVAPGERRYEAGAAKERKDGDEWIHYAESAGRIADFFGSVAESCLMTVPVLGLSFRALRHGAREMSNEYFSSGAVTEKSIRAAMLEFSKDTAKDIAKGAMMQLPKT